MESLFLDLLERTSQLSRAVRANWELRTSEDRAADLRSFPGLEKVKALGFRSVASKSASHQRRFVVNESIPPV